MANRTSTFSTSRQQTLRWLLPFGTLSALSLGGVWEVFRGHRHHLLLILLTFFVSGLVVLTSEFLRSRKALADAHLAHDQLRGALLAGSSVAWDLDVKTGKDQWFGDLKTMFGIPAETFTLQQGEFYRRVHPDDRRRVSEAVAHAQVNHVPYVCKLRIVREDGSVRWVSASGEFKYSPTGDPVQMLGIATDITDLKLAEDARDKSEEKFSKIFHQSPIAMTLTSTRDDRFLDVNEAFERGSGWRCDEAIGRTPFDLNLWPDRKEREELVKRALAENGVSDIEVRFRHKDGMPRTGLASAELIQVGDEPCILLATVDITDRKKAQEDLRQKESELAEAQHLAHVGSWQFDLNARKLSWSDELFRIHGLDPGLPPPQYEEFARLFTAESWERLRKTMEGAIETGKVAEVDLELVRPDGSKRWISTRGQAVRDTAGNVISIHGTSQDITDRKCAEQAIHESEERFRRVVEHVGDALLVYDVEGRAVFANDRFYQLFGFRKEQLPTLQIGDLVAPEYRSEVRDRHDLRMRGESAANNFELEGIRADGSRMWLEVDVVPTVGRDGKITGGQSVMRDITERKQAQRAIHDSEERLRHLIESSNDLVYEMDLTGAYTYVGPQCRELLGYEPEELVGKKPLDFMPAEEVRRIKESFQNNLTEPKSFSRSKTTRLHKDGRTVIWETNGVPIFGKNGEFCGYRGMVRDITERHQAEEQLRESEDRFRRVVEHIADALIVDDVKGHIVFANDHFLNLFGFRRDELENLAMEDYVAPEFQAELRDRHRRRMSGEELSSRYEFQGLRRDGTRLWMDAEVVAIKDTAGRVIGSQRLLRDRTDQKRAQQVLRESEERLRHLISSSNDWVWEVDSKGTYTYAGPQCSDILGYEPAEIIGKTPFDLMPPEEALRVAAIFNPIAAERKAFRALRNVNLHKDGHVVVLETNGVPILDSDGSLRGYRGIDHDITERDRAEHALRESEERFRLVANTAPVMIWTSGTDQQCDYFNRPWLDFTGKALEAELGDGWLKGVHPDDSEVCIQTYTKAFDLRKSFEMQYRLRRHDGQYRWLLDLGVPRFNADGSFAGYIGSCIDITERKQVEEALTSIGRRLIEAHEEERTRIGRELHDDINQRLAFMSVELDQWLKGHHSNAPVRELIRHTQERITELARDVQSLSHRLHSSKLEYLGLARAASSFCRELSVQSKVEIAFTHDSVPLTLPKEISLCVFRVLQEALQNAVKYSGVADFSVDLRGSSDSIELIVRDTGRGFDPAEAFNRQGLGLISMRERLQMVHGELSIRSTPGSGTTVRARVPLESVEPQAMAG